MGLERAGQKTDLEGRILRPGDLLDIGSEGTIWLTDDLPALVSRPPTIYWTSPWWPMINSNLLMSQLHPLLLLLLPTQTCFCRVPKSVTMYPVTLVKNAGSPSIPLHSIPSSNLLPKCFSHLCGLCIRCYHCQVPAGPYQFRPGLPTKASYLSP